LAFAKIGLAKAVTCCVVHVSSLKAGVTFPARKINALKESKTFEESYASILTPAFRPGK